MPDFPVTVACYCGTIQYPINLFVTSNPAKVDFCHCSSCRTWSGGICPAAIRCSAIPTALLSGDQLTAYTSSPGIVHYFCTSCGTHLECLHAATEGEEEWWNVNVGAIKDYGELRVEPGDHQFVRDTKDGGGAELWTKGTRWAGGLGKGEQLAFGWHADARDAAIPTSSPDDRLLAECQCGGVSFFITRPNEASKGAMRRGWPYNMLGEYPLAATHDPKEEYWWLRPLGAETRTQYMAAICACDTCQRGLGFWGAAWAYVPKWNLVDANGKPIDLNNIGTLKSGNRGDTDVHRDFCGKCGATVFWWQDSRGPMVDVAVGILRAPEGARAEGWLEWVTAGLVNLEDGRPENIYQELKEGLKAYGERRDAAVALEKSWQAE